MKKKNRKEQVKILYGVFLIALFSCAAFFIAELPFVKKMSFSPLIVGILIGMVYANTLRLRLPAAWVPGIQFCAKQMLRLGIILYGFRLTVGNIVEVGAGAI
ncbi:MAG: putative sulfate exporter family transporter, partial [Bacteroidales bacterium]|nr:putative sulfate exporter family transporter [Bacteroidales bacterium]